MVVIAILFWMWFLASVVILVRRSIRRRRERRIRREAMRVALHDSAAAAATAATEAAEVEAAEVEAAEVIDDAIAVAAAPAPAAPTPAPPAPTRTPAAAPPTIAVAPTSSPAPSSVATIARAAAAPVTVGQVIAGIEMPCELVPLTLSDHDMRYDRGQRAHFVTTSVPALVVMTNLTEELERIGLTVTPIGDTAAIAKRGRLAVELRVNTIGALVDGVASTEFRSAPPNSVVVAFDVVPV
ncbi:MAG TPA: hypothetical protein VM282_19935 [Acidimicrobiales bacterium]|nr:hypothetical protein [Acidimicrobiales bacterium]